MILEIIGNPLKSLLTSVISFTCGSIPTMFAYVNNGFLTFLNEGMRQDVVFVFQIIAFAITIISGIATLINYQKKRNKNIKS